MIIEKGIHAGLQIADSDVLESSKYIKAPMLASEQLIPALAFCLIFLYKQC